LYQVCATLMVQKNAQRLLCGTGQKGIHFDSKQSGIPLFIESASATFCAWDRTRLHICHRSSARMRVSAANFHGAGIFAVTAGSVAAKAGLKANDIRVTSSQGAPSPWPTDLRVEVDSMAAGDQALIKLRRNGAKDVTVTARF